MTRTLLRTSRFDVEVAYRTLPDGSLHQREIIRHNGAVVILPLVSDDQVCLLRNYRVSVDQWLWELPAGTLERGEQPALATPRELKEETGYSAHKIELIHTFCMSPGILDEKMYFFVASELEAGPPAHEPGEEMENHIFSWCDIDRMLRDGQIVDAKTLVALLWYLRYRNHA